MRTKLDRRGHRTVLAGRRKPRLHGANPLSDESRDEDPSNAPLPPHLVAFNDGWQRLRSEGLDHVYATVLDASAAEDPTSQGRRKANLDARRMSSLYTLTYNMCVQEIPYNWSAKLYYALKDELNRVCAEKVLRRLKEPVRGCADLLRRVAQVWRRWLFLLKKVKAIFGYLERFYVKRLRLMRVEQMGIQAFHDHVFAHLKEDITAAFLKAVEQDRRKEGRASAGNRASSDVDIEGSEMAEVAAPGSPSLASDASLENDGSSSTNVSLSKAAEKTPRGVINADQAKRASETTGSTEEASAVSRSLLQQIADIFHVLGTAVYRDELELPLLQSTEKHLSKEADKWLTNHTASMYLYHVRATVRSEVARVEQIMLLSTMDKMAAVCHRQLLAEKLECILESSTGCEYLLEKGHTDELKLLFNLLSNVRAAMPCIATCFKNHLIKHGLKLMKDTSLTKPLSNENREGESGLKESNLTVRVLHLHEQNLRMIGQCFNGHHAFHRALKDAFEEFLNVPIQGAADISQIITDYLDRSLRKRPREMVLTWAGPDEEIQDATDLFDKGLSKHLCGVIHVFKYVSEKDVFAELYRKKLAKRLLLERSRSIRMEEEIIAEISATCGRPFASKLSGMLSDLKVTQRFGDAWKKHLEEAAADLGFEMEVKALSAGFWPSYRSETLVLPPSLSIAKEQFQKFYETQTSSRKLSWVHSLGSLWIEHAAKSGPISLLLNTFQACILLLFNNHEVLSLPQIAGLLGLQTKQVFKYIRSLCTPKYQLLICDNGEVDGGADSGATFRVNEAFESKRRRLRVPMIPQLSKMGEKDREKSYKKVYDDRKFAMDAAIVRLMKAQGRMKEEQLIAQTMKSLSALFKVDRSMLQKRLKDLVDREYIAKSADDSSMINYVQ